MDTTSTRIFRGLPPKAQRQEVAIAIGNFDGVHRGHQALLKAVAKKAKEKNLLSAVLTFEPHPRVYFGDRSILSISTLRDRYNAILDCGIERIYVLPFTIEFASLSPNDFIEKILVRGLNTKWVTAGENFHFGDKGTGSIETLAQMSSSMGFEFAPSPLLTTQGKTVSSTEVRKALYLGKLKEVQELLGRPYCITGRVVHGAALGRTLGFPTLNIDILPPGSVATPALRGVYAVKVTGIDDTKTIYKGVASLGVKPTVTAEARWLLETNVFDWSGDAYGKIICVEFVQKLRDEKKFSGLEELKSAIAKDAQKARDILSH